METFSTLTKTNIKAWHNTGKFSGSSPDSFQWVEDQHQAIYEHLKTKFSNKGTLARNIFSLASVLKVNHQDQANKYSEIGAGLNKVINENEKNQTLDDNEKKHYKTFKEIVEKREELKEKWNEKPENVLLHYQYLALCMYSMMPPIRTEYSDIEIVNKQYISITTGQYNALVKEGKNLYLYINKDKVSDKHPPLYTKVPKQLQNIIAKSFEILPRQYLFSNRSTNKTPMSKGEYNTLLNSIFPPSFGVRNLRSSYITDFYKKNHTLKEKEELATKMRHSASTANLNYNKITKSDRKTVTQKYYKSKSYDILRRKIINNIKKGSHPRNETVKRYNLKFDPETDSWS